MDKVSRGFHFAPEVLKGLVQIEFGQLTVFDQPTTPNKILKIHFVWFNFRELAKKNREATEIYSRKLSTRNTHSDGILGTHCQVLFLTSFSSLKNSSTISL